MRLVLALNGRVQWPESFGDVASPSRAPSSSVKLQGSETIPLVEHDDKVLLSNPLSTTHLLRKVREMLRQSAH